MYDLFMGINFDKYVRDNYEKDGTLVYFIARLIAEENYKISICQKKLEQIDILRAILAEKSDPRFDIFINEAERIIKEDYKILSEWENNFKE